MSMSEIIEPVDKSSWPRGSWDHEPDRREWEHAGFPCLIQRVSSGGLCGYVAVPPGHSWHSKHYDEIDADVHGGLTYAQPCEGNICHVPKPGEPDNVWWLGFDHAHSNDLCPGIAFMARDGVYRDFDYVSRGVESLAEQARTAQTQTDS
jgi:hypothetical protein